MARLRNLTTLLLCFGTAASGCGRTDEPLVETAPAATSPAVETTTAAVESQPNANASKSPELAEPQKQTDQIAQYTPPFPDRLDLFEPPQRAKGSVRREDEHGETVELKGFIDVDEPRVVLSIDGVISSIPEGGEKYGVQVISIEPPTVVLQRGRNRWPATLE
ncbi:MAG: hypothetical protein L0228_14585 [Planctomycetes bacterium]|nr:hypothetical protein [Planctomycetota bacterium]